MPKTEDKSQNENSYYTREYRIYTSPEEAAMRIASVGTKVKDNLYHVNSFTVAVNSFAEGGEKAVLILSTKIDPVKSIEILVDELFKLVNLNYSPIYSLDEFLNQLDATEKKKYST